MIEFNSSDSALCEGDSEVWLSYRELGEKVDQYADRLKNQLTPPHKSLVFLFCENTLESILYYLAALKSNTAIALLDASLDQSFKFDLVKQYQPELVVDANPTADWNSEPFSSDYSLIPDPKSLIFKRIESDLPTINPELALLLPTSGTTGSPKFVRLSKRNIEANAASIKQALEITAQQRPVTSLPFHYSYGLSVLNSHLHAGASIIVTKHNILNNDFWQTVRSKECTSFAGVPYSYQLLHRLDLNKLNVPTLKILTQAGGRLNNDLILSFDQLMNSRGGKFFVMYGQTGATARIAIVPPDRLPEKIGSAGIAIPGGKLTVSAEGSIVYTGANVMLGYANNRADLPAGDVMNEVLDTGDIGHLDEEGFLFITGRLKRIAKIFGYRLNLDEIEILLNHYGPTAVIGSDDKIVIYCETDSNNSFAEQKQFLSKKLHLDQSIFEFRSVPSLPRTSSGKVDYQPLQQRER